MVAEGQEEMATPLYPQANDSRRLPPPMKTIVLTLLAGATVSTTAAEPQLLIPKALLEAPLVEVQGVIRTAAKATLVDGVYTGPAVDAYWGAVQVQATV